MLNLGHLIDHTARQLAGAYLLTEHAAPAETRYRRFLAEVQRSPLLKAEYLVFGNLRRRGLAPGLVLEYAQRNLAQLTPYSQGELRAAHQRLRPFLETPAGAPAPLDAAIQTLILESLAVPGHQRVNAYYDALRLVTESLEGTPEAPRDEPVDEVGDENDDFTADQLLAGSATPLQEALAPLSDADRRLLFTVTGTDAGAKQTLFEAYHARATELLRPYPESEGALRLREMAYELATVDEDLMDLHELLQPE